MFDDKKMISLCWDNDIGEAEKDEMPRYTADFETTTDENDCRVWAWAICDIKKPDNIVIGNSIETFIDWCALNTGSKLYFHNLKFDASFILDYILKCGWKWVEVRNEAARNTFTTLISDLNQFYSICLYFDEGKRVEFLDSLKIIPMRVGEIPAAFGLDIEKLDLDYKEKREVGHEITAHEEDYIKNDVRICAYALRQFFDHGMRRMTIGSNALHQYKEIIGEARFRDWFPEPSYDEELRHAGCYKGGFVAVNKKVQGKIVGSGTSFDVNSLYPSVMACTHGELLPWGSPIYYEGEYKYDPHYPLYIQFIDVDFEIREGFIPCIQIKNNARFCPTEYIEKTDNVVTLCLTSVDLELLLKHYKVNYINYICGYKFKASSLLFSGYVEKWTKVKTMATINNNKGLRSIAKLMQNTLYGKFATNPMRMQKAPYLEDGVVKYRLLNPEYGEAVYLPVAAFITAWARKFTIDAAQANYGRWLYSDTDSCYFLGDEYPEGMEVDHVILGDWAPEHHFTRFKALRAKTYCFEEDGKLYIKCAGMPASCHKHVTMENFEYGSQFEGKLLPKEVKGGIVLLDVPYTLHK